MIQKTHHDMEDALAFAGSEGAPCEPTIDTHQRDGSLLLIFL
jgi:hypothetical protein